MLKMSATEYNSKPHESSNTLQEDMLSSHGWPSVRGLFEEDDVLLKTPKKVPPWQEGPKMQRWFVATNWTDLTVWRRLSKMGRSESIFIGLGRTISCWKEDSKIYNIDVEGFSILTTEHGRKSPSLQQLLFERD